MEDVLRTESNFRSLSVKDLLQARDQYHYHLMNKANVVGTAIGLYLIRDSEHERRAIPRGRSNDRSGTPRREPRTFGNSSVRDYSWPCVLVLVKDWVLPSEFGSERGKLDPAEMVPRTLYMSDGRMVPVCVVLVQPAEPDPRRLPEWHWPDSLYAGGMPIIADNQEQQRYATAGCLVTDGHTVYALTSRHVCGEIGEPVFTLAFGSRVPIGTASKLHLTRRPFTEVYPEFAGRRTYVNLDVGLIELDNLNDWTSQIFGLGPTGALADLNEINISPRLIEAPVVAMGAASGRLEGRIKALFYRYKSVGGYDYVSDFLIAPRKGAAGFGQGTQPGDSGAVWNLVTNQKKPPKDAKPNEDNDFSGDLRPLAIEWGGQVFVDQGAAASFTFALATSLTTVCSSLDVELTLEHNTGVLPYWGQMGHYSIGSFACDALTNAKLRSFMKANRDRLSFSIANLSPKQISARLKDARENGSMVPLADVPDIIWKQHKTKIHGGRDDRFVGFRTTGPEHPTHYADIDERRDSDNRTLRRLCLMDPANVSVEFWQTFYDEMGHTAPRDRGLLPFRVWQFFDSMVDFAKAKDSASFLCAAGLLSHYVGDACQPLHGSMYADGYGEDVGGTGVHSTYETKMIDRHAAEIVTGIQNAIDNAAAALPKIETGHDAAVAIIALMDRSARTIPPTKLVDAFIEAGGKTTVAVQDALWEDFGKKTVKVMTDGARVLAHIWQAAWREGSGNNIPASKLGVIGEDTLQDLYTDLEFVPSLDLDHIGAVLR